MKELIIYSFKDSDDHCLLILHRTKFRVSTATRDWMQTCDITQIFVCVCLCASYLLGTLMKISLTHSSSVSRVSEEHKHCDPAVTELVSIRSFSLKLNFTL